MGYVASLFLTYSFIVMPALAGVDDNSFVAAFQGLETRFQDASNIPGYEPFGYGNIPALIAFPGALVLSIVAAIQHRQTIYFKWFVWAIVLFVAGMVTTVLYNLPANYEIFAAGKPNEIDARQVRKSFNESLWLNANHFRALTTTLAAFCISWSLYLKLKFTGPEV